MDDYISLDVNYPGARCTPCKNKIDEMLGMRKNKLKNNDDMLYQSRHFICWKPWVLKKHMNSNQYHAYKLAWAKLEQQGYPRCLDTTVVLKRVEAEVAKNIGKTFIWGCSGIESTKPFQGDGKLRESGIPGYKYYRYFHTFCVCSDEGAKQTTLGVSVTPSSEHTMRRGTTRRESR
jgi:hypothetical protein